MNQWRHYGAGVYSLAIRDSIPTVGSGYIVSILYSPTLSFSLGTNIIDQVLVTAATEIRVHVSNCFTLLGGLWLTQPHQHLSDQNIPYNHPKCATGKNSSLLATTQLSASNRTATLLVTTPTINVSVSKCFASPGGSAFPVRTAQLLGGRGRYRRNKTARMLNLCIRGQDTERSAILSGSNVWWGKGWSTIVVHCSNISLFSGSEVFKCTLFVSRFISYFIYIGS